MPHRRTCGALAAVVLTTTMSACGSSPAAPAPTTPARDSIGGVTNMVPAPGTTLPAGQTVTFSGTPAYTLASADLGMVYMSIEDQNDRPLDSSDIQVVTVHRGDGDATLTHTVTLPAEGITAVHLYFLLAPAGATSTNTVIRLTYPVR